MARVHVGDAADDRLSAFRSVPDPELLIRQGIFCAEGRLVVRRLLDNPRLETCAVMVTEAALAALDDVLREPAFPVYVVSQAVMNAVGGYNFHRGCLALGRRPPLPDWREVASGASRLVALERVGNADNVGAIFRNAAAFGVHGVLLDDDCADPLYRKAIRTSMAASLNLPYARTTWPGALLALREQGWMTVAMTPATDAPLLREVAAASANRRVAIALGHEGDGLAGTTQAACTHQARIEMAAGVDSVNVATAAAIALYEMGLGPPTPFTSRPG